MGQERAGGQPSAAPPAQPSYVRQRGFLPLVICERSRRMKPANYTLRTRLLYRARWYGRPGNNVWRLLPDGRSVSSLADQKWSGTFGKPIASFVIAFSPPPTWTALFDRSPAKASRNEIWKLRMKFPEAQGKEGFPFRSLRGARPHPRSACPSLPGHAQSSGGPLW